MARSLAFLGTASDVGKSVITAAVGYLLEHHGLAVAPYKAQNMSNNSFVTSEGGEMGRAQVVQARACGIEPHTDMNPILLKPASDTGSQVVIHGEVFRSVEARDYYTMSAHCREAAFESLHRLQEKYDLLVMEGAGSCAEINLRGRDFVNFPAALEADAAVILVADIERGGVFAQVVGTIELLSPEERALVKGIIINRFRGDVSLFDSGVSFLEERTGIPVLGVVPWMSDMPLEEEDAVALYSMIDPAVPVDGVVKVGVVVYPHVSNYTDFAPLSTCEGVGVTFMTKPHNLHEFDVLILAGTKSVVSDLRFLKERGWNEAFQEFKGKIFGICGGYQMLGGKISDPLGIDGTAGDETGFSLLPTETVFESKKRLSNSRGYSELFKCDVSGYEIHHGRTECNGTTFSQLEDGVLDGAVSSDGRVAATYLHGLFEDPAVVKAFLNWAVPAKAGTISITADPFQEGMAKVAKHVEQALDMDTLMKIAEV